MTICDSHIHVGALSESEIVFPHDCCEFYQRHNIHKCCVIPTAKVDGGDDLLLHKQLYQEAQAFGFMSILYVNYEVLELLKSKRLTLGTNFGGIKIHPDAIDITDDFLNDVCRIADEVSMPLLIHTGGRECSRARRFLKWIVKFPSLIFILCHARPEEDAFLLLDNYQNVWIDTAFVPIDVLQKHVNTSNYKRILFGTDYPINRWYNNDESDDVWYDMQVSAIERSFSEDIAKSILYQNFTNLFS